MKIIRSIEMAVLTILINSVFTVGQVPGHAGILEKYIQEGLGNNMAMQQENFSIEKSILALKEARGLFHPTVSLQSDFSSATGGRKIELPLGTMLNPVYTNLNQLNATNEYQQLQNQQISLLPSTYQDTRLKIVAPIVNNEIRYINQLYKEVINEKKATLNVYKRELILEIRVAYYHYLQSVKIIEVYKNANFLLQENLRYTEILLKNGMGIKSNLLIVNAKISKNSSLITEAENQAKIAAAYFNFLMNKSMDSPIEIDNKLYNENEFSMLSEHSENISAREEIIRVKSLIAQSVINVKKEKSAAMPQLSAFMDVGVQGTEFRFNSDDRYMVGGVQLKWSLYNGVKTSNKIKQVRNDQHILNLKLKELESWFQIEYANRNLELKSAIAKLAGSKSNQELSAEFYRETQLRYRQGQALPVELMQAFTQLLNTQLDCQLDKTNILIKQAEVERSTAAFTL